MRWCCARRFCGAPRHKTGFLVGRHHAVVLLAELNSDLIYKAQMGQIFELSVAVYPIADVAAFAYLFILLDCKLFNLLRCIW